MPITGMYLRTAMMDRQQSGKKSSLEAIEHPSPSCHYPSASTQPTRLAHESFLRSTIELLLQKAVFGGTSRVAPVLKWHSPTELAQKLDLALRPHGESQERLLTLMEDVVDLSVKTGHPYFANQLFGGLDPYGLAGQWLTDALNPSVYTYEVAPVFTLMEEMVLREMRSIVGFPNGEGDGIFCPGGSLANGYAISCARHKFLPDIKKTGLSGIPRLVLFTSEDAHYSIKKMASFEGIGADNVYLIRTDENGRMSIPHLLKEIDRSIHEGALPFMVSATAGTTVLGSFDPLDKLADICSEFGLWLHVDAAWGGGALLSSKHRHLLRGVERADSVTWNPHKLLCAPQQCSTLLLRHPDILSDAHSAHAAYLFQKDKFYDTSYDTGDKHIQCGRRADVLKFWLMWKAKGTVGLEKHIEKVFELSKYFTELISNRPGFELVLKEPECTNVCFWYVPTNLRTNRNQMNEKIYLQKLNAIAPKIKEKMMKEGTAMVTYQSQREFPNFFRIVFQNSGLDKNDMLYFVELFERLGQDL